MSGAPGRKSEIFDKFEVHLLCIIRDDTTSDTDGTLCLSLCLSCRILLRRPILLYAQGPGFVHGNTWCQRRCEFERRKRHRDRDGAELTSHCMHAPAVRHHQGSGRDIMKALAHPSPAASPHILRSRESSLAFLLEISPTSLEIPNLEIPNQVFLLLPQCCLTCSISCERAQPPLWLGWQP